MTKSAYHWILKSLFFFFAENQSPICVFYYPQRYLIRKMDQRRSSIADLVDVARHLVLCLVHALSRSNDADAARCVQAHGLARLGFQSLVQIKAIVVDLARVDPRMVVCREPRSVPR